MPSLIFGSAFVFLCPPLFWILGLPHPSFFSQPAFAVLYYGWLVLLHCTLWLFCSGDSQAQLSRLMFCLLCLGLGCRQVVRCCFLAFGWLWSSLFRQRGRWRGPCSLSDRHVPRSRGDGLVLHLGFGYRHFDTLCCVALVPVCCIFTVRGYCVACISKRSALRNRSANRKLFTCSTYVFKIF